MFCRKCGRQLPENADFCRNCGENVKSYHDEYDGEIKFEKKDRIVDALHIVNIIQGVAVILGILAACEALR